MSLAAEQLDIRAVEVSRADCLVRQPAHVLMGWPAPLPKALGRRSNLRDGSWFDAARSARDRPRQEQLQCRRFGYKRTGGPAAAPDALRHPRPCRSALSIE